jgi:hypothetical protein
VDFSSSEETELLLFEGVDRNTIQFDPVFELAAELFTHLGVACMYPPFSANLMTHTIVVNNPGGRKSGSRTPYSISELVT